MNDSNAPHRDVMSGAGRYRCRMWLAWLVVDLGRLFLFAVSVPFRLVRAFRRS